MVPLGVPESVSTVGDRYRQIYTANISPKRRKIHINTHIYICFWPISTCTGRIDLNAETGAGNKWNIGKKALSGKCKGDKSRKEPNQSQTWANPPTHADPNPKERRQHEAEAERGHPRRACSLGAVTPPSAPQTHPSRASSDQYGGWLCGVDLENIPPTDQAKPLYKRGEGASLYTHTTTWEHTSLHSLPPLFSLD
jgi:hypothetical protein